MKLKGILTAVSALLLTFLAACATATEPIAEAPPDEQNQAAPTAVPLEVTLPDLGEAPEIRNEVWINADAPITLASQRGKVVLLEFWTFG